MRIGNVSQLQWFANRHAKWYHMDLCKGKPECFFVRNQSCEPWSLSIISINHWYQHLCANCLFPNCSDSDFNHGQSGGVRSRSHDHLQWRGGSSDRLVIQRSTGLLPHQVTSFIESALLGSKTCIHQRIGVHQWLWGSPLGFWKPGEHQPKVLGSCARSRLMTHHHLGSLFMPSVWAQCRALGKSAPAWWGSCGHRSSKSLKPAHL